MFHYPSRYNRTICLGAALLAGLMTSACSFNDMLKDVHPDYKMTSEGGNKDTDKYLEDLLDDRVTATTDKIAAKGPDRDAQENYIEQTVRADILKGLQSKGYYNARVQYKNGTEPFQGEYTMKYGPQFTVSSINVKPAKYQEFLNENLVQTGAPLDAQAVLDTQSALARRAQRGSCYFTFDVENAVTLNREAHTGAVSMLVAAGPQANFGPVTFNGQEKVKESYLRKLLPWKDGDCYKTRKLEEYKISLLESGLFASADAQLPKAPDKNGNVPITFDLRERAQRSVSGGLNYYSDTGPGATFGWEHRNLWGSAEKLTLDADVSSILQSLKLGFTVPYFIRKDQTLGFTSAIDKQETDAYDELGMTNTLTLSRKITPHFTATTGVGLAISQIDDNAIDDTDDAQKTYGLISFPQGFSYDTRRNTLDPRGGVYVTGNIEPFFDVLGESDPFLKTELTGSTYYDFNTRGDFILAGKAGVSNIWGAMIQDVPATERFYAGGGGSVRGFAYQEVGPQEDGDPTGGTSLVNFSVEARKHITDKIGGVFFIDGASISESQTPKFQNPAIGAGVGLRYYTSFGPIRFDIATPLTQKEDLDQNYQFYISIGQAF